MGDPFGEAVLGGGRPFEYYDRSCHPTLKSSSEFVTFLAMFPPSAERGLGYRAVVFSESAVF